MPGFCLDTGPILDLAVLRYYSEVGGQSLVDVSVPPPIASLVRGLVGPFERRAFANLLRRARPISTIEGVLVEIGYKIERTTLNNSVFWRVVQGSYSQWLIEELPAPLSHCDPAALTEYGPVDEALLQHCVRTGATLISIERPLRSRANRLGVSVLHPTELVAYFS